MKLSLRKYALAVLSAIPVSALACQPITGVWEPSLNEVKRNFDQATFVVSAEVVDVRKVVRVSISDIEYPVERATFRVERAFKGTLKPGATFRIDTGGSTCGRGFSIMNGD